MQTTNEHAGSSSGVGACAAQSVACAAPLPWHLRLARKAQTWWLGAAADEASRKEITIYAAAGLGEGLAVNSIRTLTMPILNMTLGVDPRYISIVGGIKTFWDAVTDPVFGHITDNFRSRWGRRRPFIALGGVLVGIMMFAIWLLPPGKSPLWYLLYYATAMMLLTVATTIFSVAYYALGIELSPTYHGRTRVTAFRSFLNGLTGYISPWFLRFCLIGAFGGIVMGARVLGAILGCITICVCLYTAIACRERTEISVLKRRKKEKFFVAIKGCASNVHFWKITTIYIVLSTMGALFEQFGQYVNVYYVFGGNMKAAAGLMALGGMIGTSCAMVGIPLVAWVSSRIGKHNALRLTVLLMMIGDVSRWVLYNPKYPYLMLLNPLFYSIGISATYTILSSMQADVVDVDELLSGQRREGMFGAVASVVMKSASALAITIAGFVLYMTGFNKELGGGQTAQTFLLMRIMFSFAPLSFLCVVQLLLCKYPLTAQRMNEIHVELKRRHAAAAAEAATSPA
jgi:GPH family glycoside/pentoside/hexuronide:cation symporter